MIPVDRECLQLQSILMLLCFGVSLSHMVYTYPIVVTISIDNKRNSPPVPLWLVLTRSVICIKCVCSFSLIQANLQAPGPRAASYASIE